eukprot:PLAT14150.1.p1 GENE.PLAT14150.1~~PLAT14150.1.p1  ORF type:complete len:293 (-),score=87.84 PLAT14150.1:101-979(-)
MADASEAASLLSAWARRLKKCNDFDSWGQVLEASEELDALAQSFEKGFADFEPTFEQRSRGDQIILCLRLRAKMLVAAEEMAGPSLDDMRALPAVIRRLLDDDMGRFPVDLTGFDVSAAKARAKETTLDRDGEEEVVSGSLLPPPRYRLGRTYIEIAFEKYGLKDAERYIQPYVTISVARKTDVVAMESQDTPRAVAKKPTYVMFEVNVHLQTDLETLMEEEAAVFFEFKHYKPRKSKVSTRCWAVMEAAEIEDGPKVLENYKKPSDYRLKKIKLFTEKPLYVHMVITLHRL